MNALQFQKNLLSMQENMRNFARMLTSNQDDAEDLLQDTTLKVLNNQGKFVDDVNFKGWVLTIMRNIFVNQYHQMVRTRTLIDSMADLYPIEVVNESGATSPESACTVKEIHAAINRLDPSQRVPFSMFLEGYKYSEIAIRLEIPLGTIKSRIFFARKQLQRELKENRYA